MIWVQVITLFVVVLIGWVETCPIDPMNGVCPEPLVWVETASHLPLTAEQFLQILPQLVIILLVAWGTKTLLRMIFNR